jgi:hypothetical protein
MPKKQKRPANPVAATEKATSTSAFDGPEAPEDVRPQREPVEPWHEVGRRGRIGPVPTPQYDGPDPTVWCFDLENPSRVFVRCISGRLSLSIALGVFGAALEAVGGTGIKPLGAASPAHLVAAVQDFFRSRRQPLPRYLQMTFDPGPGDTLEGPSKANMRGFIDACAAVLKLLQETPNGELAAAAGKGPVGVQGTCLTTVDPTWQDQPVPAPKPEKPILDVPLLSESSMPALPESGRPSTVIRRVDFRALEQRKPELNKVLAMLHEPVLRRYQEFLNQLVGEACPSGDENNKLVKLVNGQAEDFGIALLCDDGGGWKQVRLRFSSGVFEAWTPGRDCVQVYSGAGFPSLRAGHRAGAAGAGTTSGRPQ